MSFTNLHYIRAAIEQNTGKRLSFKKIKQLLVEEKLISKRKAESLKPFRYSEYFQDTSYGSVSPYDSGIDAIVNFDEDPEDLQIEANLIAKFEEESR